MEKQPNNLETFLAGIYQLGYKHNVGYSALVGLSELIENKLGPAAETYDEMMTELTELRKRVEAFERLERMRTLNRARPGRRQGA